MREEGNGPLFLPEKNKASGKINGKDECGEGRRRMNHGGGYGATNGGGRAIISNNQSNGMVVTGGRVKGGNMIQGRHTSQQKSLIYDNSSIASEVAVAAEGEPLGKRKAALDKESALPHWGHGKRSRGSRFEPLSNNKQAVSSVARSEKAAPSPAPTQQRGLSKLISNKASPNGLPPRNGLISKTANGFVHTDTSSHSPSSRQNGGETKSTILASNATQQKSAEADYGICRELQGGDGSELATATQGHLRSNDHHHSNGHVNRSTNNSDGNTLSHTNNAACSSLWEPSSLLKSRVDFQSLEWPRIVIALTRKEKEDDFLVLKGSKLPQRPKKRPKVVERALHYSTPGNWLLDLSRGRYDVREKRSGRKKPRGLKAMESIESETE